MERTSSLSTTSSSQSHYKPRNLIVCFDGTANGFDTLSSTNIGLFFESLNKSSENQLCWYQPGIGTYIPSNRAFAMLPNIAHRIVQKADEVIAWSLGDHIVAGYKFLMDNYNHGDKICIFGFSRGAYIARSLASMLGRVGLLCKGNVEYLSLAYSNFSRDTGSGSAHRACTCLKRRSRNVSVEFLGVWDTVTSVGISGHTLPLALNVGMVKYFRHALALDERRAKFLYRPIFHDPNVGHDGVAEELGLEDAAKPVKKQLHGIEKFGSKLLHAAHKPHLQGIHIPHLHSPHFHGIHLPHFHASHGHHSHATHEPRCCAAHDPLAPPLTPRTPQTPQSSTSEYFDRAEVSSGSASRIKEVWFVGAHSDVGGLGNDPDPEAPKLSNLSLLWMLQELDAVGLNMDFESNAFRESLLLDSFINRRPAFDALMDWVENTVPNPADESSFNRYNDVPADVSPLITDVFVDVRDDLNGLSPWWLVEAIPVWKHDNADADEHAHKHLNINAGRPRRIWHSDPHFHWSVKLRLVGDPNYTPKAQYEGQPVFHYERQKKDSSAGYWSDISPTTAGNEVFDRSP